MGALFAIGLYFFEWRGIEGTYIVFSIAISPVLWKIIDLIEVITRK
jgi:hypothetical protein